ncbi:MAG: L-serine ammonia-lyase [Cellvibrionales bacterium]|nr:L-serine ammonia-lyase [Cellvibrionales bacterium]
MISIFEIFKIGIGPSSSHTVGPMKAAKQFVETLSDNGLLVQTTHIEIELYGSLALTGIGHHTDQAILLGLSGESPETVDIDNILHFLDAIKQQGQFFIQEKNHSLRFTPQMLHLIKEPLPLHENGLRFIAYHNQKPLFNETYYSIGGGFIHTEQGFSDSIEEKHLSPYEFHSAKTLIQLCEQHDLTISQLMQVNEQELTPPEMITIKVLSIWQVMQQAIETGCHATTPLPGKLQLKRRAPDLFKRLNGIASTQDPLSWVDWVNLYALAVSEQNAAGGRIVTSPTNGAAGIIPAVMSYYHQFIEPLDYEKCKRFLMTAGAIAILFKLNASISGAEVGCQGETGVSSAMAAAGLAELLGASPRTITEAAEIAMEHHLGLTCDPVGGQVQIPCIERNAMSSMKAVNAARMAMTRSSPATVSLDAVIATMRETGKDMHAKYRETSLGGLATQIAPVCK